MPDPKKKKIVKGPFKVSKRSVVKMKGKGGGKNTETFKNKSYVSNMDDTKISRVKMKTNKRGNGRETFKQVKKNKDGSYTLQRGKEGGNFTSRKISKIRGKSMLNRMKKKRAKMNKKK